MPQDARRPRSLSRRGVLAAGLASGGMLLVPSQAHAQEAEELEPYHTVDPSTERDLTAAEIEADEEVISPLALGSRSSINGTRLYYEPTRATSSFTFDNTFNNQLVAWRNNIGGYVPSGWGGSGNYN
jgi:hypothetical protein